MCESFYRIKCKNIKTCDKTCGAIQHKFTHFETHIANLFLIRREIKCRKGKKKGTTYQLYSIFPTQKNVFEYRNSIKVGERSLHEVIHGFRPQKFKLDIDNIPKSWSKKICEYAIEYIVFAIKYVIHNVYEDAVGDISVVICESKGFTSKPKRRYKYGYHLITQNISIPTAGEARLICNGVVNVLSKHIALDEFLTEYKSRHPSVSGGTLIRTTLRSINYNDMIDDVHNSIQNFRLVGCHKIGEPDRIKTIITKHNKKDTLITYTKKTILLPPVLSSIYGKPTPTKTISTSVMIDDTQIESACTTIMTTSELNAFIFRDIQENPDCFIVSYDRLLPAFCDMCARTHECDNSLWFLVSKSGIVTKRCRRFDIKNLSK